MKLTNLKFQNVKLFWLSLILVATSFTLQAQEPQQDEIDALLDDLFFNDDELMDDILNSLNPTTFLYTSLTYNSNTYFSGRDSGYDQYNLTPQISLFHRSGLSIGISGIYYDYFDPNWDFTSFSLNYFKRLSRDKNIYLNGGYTYFNYTDGSDLYTNALDVGIGIKNKSLTLGTSLSANYLFGGESTYQIVSSTYARLTIFKNPEFSLRFVPQVNLLAAEQTIATYSPTDDYTYIYTDHPFSLVNTQIQLPLSFVSKHWNIDLGYILNFPKAFPEENIESTNGFFMLSAGYLINLD